MCLQHTIYQYKKNYHKSKMKNHQNHSNKRSLHKVKVIQLQDKYIDHSNDEPYIQSCKKNKHILFTLLSKKTCLYQPILLIDRYEQDDIALPLCIGNKINSLSSCFALKGQFEQDGTWGCSYQFTRPGVFNFQLVFLEYNDIQVRDVGGFDCLVVVQSKIELRKLRKQTLFPRCMGDIRCWDSFLRKQVELGYKSFLFAPIQQTGESKSYYSIYDQSQLAADIFPGDSDTRYKHLKSILTRYQQQGIVFFIDIVLNHTSINSDWIKQNENTVFTVSNTPILKSAYQLDLALKKWGQRFVDGRRQLGIVEMDVQQYEEMKKELEEIVIGLELQQFFEIGEETIRQFDKLGQKSIEENDINSQIVFEFIQENCKGLGENRRGVAIPKLKQKWANVNYLCSANDISKGIQKFNAKWNNTIKKQWNAQIINNLLGEIRYQYIEAKLKNYTDNTPLILPYFIDITFKNNSVVPVLKNGWVMCNSGESMVESKNFYYLRRMVSVWGDLIRIRYGQGESDSYSWIYMKKYMKIMLQYFDGFRLDNFHNTEIKVGERLIKLARKLKPQIIIFAQLFTREQKQKNKYIRRSGINSLLEQFRHCETGGQYSSVFYEKISKKNEYTGSLDPYFHKTSEQKIRYCRRKKPVLLLYDLTHDNKTYEQRGNAFKKIPIVLLTEFSGTFIGSTKGFDQFYAQKISVIETAPIYQFDENNKIQQLRIHSWNKKFIFPSNNPHDRVQIYGSWDGWCAGKTMQLKGVIGFEIDLELVSGRYEYKYKKNGEWTADANKQINVNNNHELILNGLQYKTVHSTLQYLRRKLNVQRQRYWDYSQYYLYCQDDIVVLLRQKKILRESVCIIVNLSKQKQKFKKPVFLPGILERADIWVQSGEGVKRGRILEVNIVNSSQIHEYFDLYFNGTEQKDVLLANELPPGFGCIIQCTKTNTVEKSLLNIVKFDMEHIQLPPLGPLDYNLIMYGVEAQEILRFHSNNYQLPEEKRKLVFGGFGGVIAEVERAKRYNTLSSGLFNNVREGNWLADYYVGRLKKFKYLASFTEVVKRYFEYLKSLPAYLRPKHFTDFIYAINIKLQKSIGKSIQNKFHKQLLLTSTQFISSLPTTNNLFIVTVSAGLPNFSTGRQRCSGRINFMSNELLLVFPSVCYDTILQFASVMRHGTIPNTIDFGVNPRYNCRDVCWGWIKCVKQYARATQDYQIYKTKVNLVFLSDDQGQHQEKVRRGQKKIMTIEDIIQHIFQSHANGIKYRQWNAGDQLDSNMESEGFDIELRIDEKTGFVVGGNERNCLTWMDNIGCSGKAKNKGRPAASRAGAPIELTAMLYHCLVEYRKLNEQSYYGYNSVKFGKNDVSYRSWAKKIRQNFESYYWQKEKKSQKIKYENIYKDVALSPPSLANESLMLRPNALIALVLAPELVSTEHALQYLNIVQKQLIRQKSIGVSTLGKAHTNLYSACYDQDNNSRELKTSGGFSKYNGPQWVWLYGFYVKARYNFRGQLNDNQLRALLQNHVQFIQNSEWRSLPQFTNGNGETNQYASKSSLWAISSMLVAIEANQKNEL